MPYSESTQVFRLGRFLIRMASAAGQPLTSAISRLPSWSQAASTGAEAASLASRPDTFDRKAGREPRRCMKGSPCSDHSQIQKEKYRREIPRKKIQKRNTGLPACAHLGGCPDTQAAGPAAARLGRLRACRETWSRAGGRAAPGPARGQPPAVPLCQRAMDSRAHSLV